MKPAPWIFLILILLLVLPVGAVSPTPTFTSYFMKKTNVEQEPACAALRLEKPAQCFLRTDGAIACSWFGKDVGNIDTSSIEFILWYYADPAKVQEEFNRQSGFDRDLVTRVSRNMKSGHLIMKENTDTGTERYIVYQRNSSRGPGLCAAGKTVINGSFVWRGSSMNAPSCVAAGQRVAQMEECIGTLMGATPKGNRLHGTIIATDMPYGIPQPLKYGIVSYTRDDGTIDRTNTNDKGEYSFYGTLTPGKKYEINVTLTYAQDKDYFTIGIWRDILDINMRYTTDFEPVVFAHRFTFRNDGDLVQDISLDELYRQKGNAGRNPFGLMYVRHQEVLEFYKDYLNEDIHQNLPVRAYLFADGEWVQRFGRKEVPRAYYQNGEGLVYGNNYSLAEHFGEQRRVVYHEFSHYMMDNIYGRWPVGRYAPGAPADQPAMVNHDGFVNPSTSDSWTEGFADFMPAVIEDYYGNGQCGVTGLDLERGNFMPWDHNGHGEEWVVASLLWDVYDDDSRKRACLEKSRTYLQKMRNSPYTDPEVKARIPQLVDTINANERAGGFSDDEDIGMTFPELWQLLRVYQSDVNSVFLTIGRSGKVNQDEFIFLGETYGMWIDRTRGNNTYDAWEPFRDKNDNGTYDTGELFIDMPPRMERNAADEPVGNPSNYQRPWRLTSKELPGHFIRVNNAVPFYFYIVEYPGTRDIPYIAETKNENGYIYAPVPPNPAAKITIYAEGVETGKPLSYTSQEFFADYDKSVQQGYYVSHDFEVKGPIPTTAPVPDFGQGGMGGPGESSSGVLPDILTVKGPLLDFLTENSRSRVPLVISVPIIIAALLVLAYVLKKG